MFELLAVVGLLVLYTIYRRYTRSSLSELRGPKSESFLLGHFAELNAIPACGVTESKWQEEFGNAFRIKGSFGEDQLFLADPKALQHVFQKDEYRKTPMTRAIMRLFLDRGIAWAEGDEHRRHRKVMLPAFGASETRAMLPIFNRVIATLVNKWSEIIVMESSGTSAILDMHAWMSKATLDAIGLAGFDYEFGAVEDLDNRLAKSFKNLLNGVFGSPSFGQMFLQSATTNLPYFILNALFEHTPSSGLNKVKENRAEVHGVSKKLLENKHEMFLQGGGKKDLMSLLVKSNYSENEKSRLRDDEIIPQMRTIINASHESTAITLSWALYQLAQTPHIQKRMRAEIREVQAKVIARNESEFTATDMEAMSYTVAILKETLRLYPVTFQLFRKADIDDVIPLHKPIVSVSGKLMNEIPVAKGTSIYVCINGCNANKDVWGPDAYEFNPERWLSEKQIRNTSPSLGLYSNLLTFSAGNQSCIGWRFALVEMQAFLVGLVQNFEFSIPEGFNAIRKDRSAVMLPMLEGEQHKGINLPLKVSLVSD